MKDIIKEETPLSTEGSFESVVNRSGTKKSANRRSFRVCNVFRTIAELAAVVAIVLLLCKLGVLTMMQGVLISEAITCAASFLAGRLWEQAFK